ncbi:hypothetical protein [Rugamonas rubra]|uniref:Uncharacterized protein n=1 Tax=Rugamonas rubra TaxID=758825 RepID=A0A1I4P8E6_9BURK|nr:hypothetical protein [Rugamonas rubra]SFM23866.1 hypothetical protein SAMN02982985_03317 [Rugamonas rubra]
MPSSIENPVPSSQPDDEPPIADLDKRAYYKYMESRLNLFEANLSTLRSDMNAGFDRLQRDVHVLQETTRRLELSDIKTQADMEMLRHDIAYIRDNYATKADLQEAMMKLTLRIMGMMMVMTGSLVGAMFFIARHSS